MVRLIHLTCLVAQFHRYVSLFLDGLEESSLGWSLQSEQVEFDFTQQTWERIIASLCEMEPIME